MSDDTKKEDTTAEDLELGKQIGEQQIKEEEAAKEAEEDKKSE